MSAIRGLAGKPICWVLLLALAGGIAVFPDYGLTWDEPLFYKYADALGYAYTPANWFSGHFDLTRSYGPSGDDHKTRGPGYLLLAREPVYLLQRLQVSGPSAWHLVNFLTYLVGVYFFYQLARRFTGEAAAAGGASIFASQPLLWGHAFINPKDMPFLVSMLAAVLSGLRMVDRLTSEEGLKTAGTGGRVLLAGMALGIATANRVLGPLAGVLVVAGFVARRSSRRGWLWMLVYACVAAGVTIAAWPYLWESPIRFLEVFGRMSENPTVLQVLFAENVYRAFELPRRYLPFLLATNLTEPIWPLFFTGLAVAAYKLRRASAASLELALILAWFLIPVAYVVAARPPMYDGMRHFLFVLPPVFLFAAVALDHLFGLAGKVTIHIGATLLLLLPGVIGMRQLHPYEYAYFNRFVGGTEGVFRRYETEYWLTCYKETVERFGATVAGPARLFVHREADVARPYAPANVTVLDQRGASSTVRSGDSVLVSTRTNEDRDTFRDAPWLLSVGRAGATFCVVKTVP